MAFTVVIAPVLQKAEKCRFYQEIGGKDKDKETIILKIQSQSEAFHLNAFLYVLKKHLCEEKNEREIRLAIYIRLEYNTSSLYNVSAKRNFRIMNVNCRSVRSNNSEFQTALNCIKPDVVFGTESWLRGVKPSIPVSADAIKSTEVFPTHYNAFKNDRRSLSSGVFTLVHKVLVALEKPEFVTDCEITWTNLKLKDRRTFWYRHFICRIKI